MKHIRKAKKFSHTTYLFKVTEMCIHCSTNCFQEFKSLFRFNSGKCSYLNGESQYIEPSGTAITNYLANTYMAYHEEFGYRHNKKINKINYQMKASLFKRAPCIMKFLVHSQHFRL